MTSRWNDDDDASPTSSSSQQQSDTANSSSSSRYGTEANTNYSGHQYHSHAYSSNMRPSNLPHRLSSNELLELEEQLQASVQPPLVDPEEGSEEDLVTASSPSDDDNDDDDDEQAHLSSMSDTDDSMDSGKLNDDDVICGGAVEEAFLQFTSTISEFVEPTAAHAVAEEDHHHHHHHHHGKRLSSSSSSSMQRISSLMDTTTTSRSNSNLFVNHDDDYSPKMKTNGSSSYSTSTTSSQKRRFLLSRFRRTKLQKDTVPAVFDFEQYMLRREMSVTQEQWNALTVLPNPMYCLYFILSAQWCYYHTTTGMSTATSSDDNEYHHHWSVAHALTQEDAQFGRSSHGDIRMGDDMGCLSQSMWHSMPVIPPLPVLAVVVGICVHAPWSFLYHWTYAHTMSATQRTKHWSRRMDQSFIHVASSFMCYGTSGSLPYFWVNALYNLDCIRRQFRPTVRPKQNQMRIIISIIAYTVPLLKQGDYETFLQLWILFSISGYFFIHYPVGGWSHAVFHIVIAFVPPLLLRTATALPVSQAQLYRAAMCAATAITTRS